MVSVDSADHHKEKLDWKEQDSAVEDNHDSYGL